MFKITLHGKTMVGNNEDAWRVNSKIWFETGHNGRYGAAYVGHEDGFPQGGMNDAGLAFDGFTVYPQQLRPAPGKKQIDNPAAFIKAIMQQCKTVDDVARVAGQYNRRIFNNGMFLFVDSTGRYLVMEADTLITGNDAKYVLSNFRPSVTKDADEVFIERYQRGRRLLAHRSDTTLAFCTTVMDNMHECRTRIGDGTTYTTIYDLKRKQIFLYFYHNFTHMKPFDLARELKKGDHVLTMSDLFRPNPEYQRFVDHKTPFNSPMLKRFIWCLELLLILFTGYWIAYNLFWRKGPAGNSIYSMWLLVVINMALGVCFFILLNNQPIFYFDAPYYVEGKSILNACAHIPLTLLALVIPVGVGNVQVLYTRTVTKLSKRLFMVNTIVYLIALLLFAYWGLLCVIQR
jgi:hypothetical protein